MRIAYTTEHEALRRELRDYFSALMTPERRDLLTNSEDSHGDPATYREVIRQIGHDGWLGIGWPKEYGGQDRSMLEQAIFLVEAAFAGAPIPCTAPRIRPGTRASIIEAEYRTDCPNPLSTSCQQFTRSRLRQ